MTILIIDDTELHRLVLAGMLEDEGYTDIVMVESALAAYAWLEQPSAQTLDLILSDLRMPNINGIEACCHIKAMEEWRDLPIIMITGDDDLDDLNAAFEAGAIDYIIKPPNEVELLARVRSAIRLKREINKRKAREQELVELSAQLSDKNAQLTAMNQTIEQMFRSLSEQHKLLQYERDRSEDLLLNVLPQPIAERLKLKTEIIAERLKPQDEIIADSFPEATVLFADIVDFTPLSSRMTPEDLVLMLNDVFQSFDWLIEKYGLEKIKTVGDSYMVAGGVPIPRSDHLEAVVNMALEMLRVITEHTNGAGDTLNIRIGIHTGPVVAGVIGIKKFTYDLWGNTVNMASRMESHGSPGKIQVGEAIYERLASRYNFEARGTISVKGKGGFQTYWLLGMKAGNI